MLRIPAFYVLLRGRIIIILQHQLAILMQKKVDSRIQGLIASCAASNQRSMFFVVGDRARYQVLNFYSMLSNKQTRHQPNVLWCYKKELGFSTHQKKRMKEIKAMQTKGIYDETDDGPFEQFIANKNLTVTYYKQTHKVLGNTYQMLILQDFEALTPNVLCRTIETVEGGGLILIMLKTMTGLKQLHTIAMDVHQRYRTDRFQDIQPRFNERFLLSLTKCQNCLFVDDQLNILNILNTEIPEISKKSLTINAKANQELLKLKQDLSHKEIIGGLVSKAKTLDQAKAIMTFVEVIVNKSNSRNIISLTAARGRGKSSAVGLSVAAAVACGFSNIFVTAPSPQNLKTFFEFVMVGLEALGYKNNMHYQRIESTNQEYNHATIRIDISKNHPQFIQYVFPSDSYKVSNADLIVIDEAAAIPLPFTKSFLKYHLVFLASTINGYEGTGRSLSLKLIQEVKEQARRPGQDVSSVQLLKEITLSDPIRYALDDPVEKWLGDLLLLDATSAVPLKQGIPHPNDCELYYVNRNTLFSHKPNSEKFLKSLMSLFISSHYKNSPNDLQLLSDSPSHMILVLLGPLRTSAEGKTEMPDVLCSVQLSFEGQISDQTISSQGQRGFKPSGDLIPWNIKEQYQDSDFPKLLGARIIRIATHPSLQKMGYGSKMLQQIILWFQSKLISLKNEPQQYSFFSRTDEHSKATIGTTLLKRADELIPPRIDYLGTSFGLTKNLFKFWNKNKFEPVYIRQTKNDITAEHSCIMLRNLDSSDNKLNLGAFVTDFKRRFISLLSSHFKNMEISLAVDILSPNITTKQIEEEAEEELDAEKLSMFITHLDLKRLNAYADNMVDFHLILDLLPTLCRLFFYKDFGSLKVSYCQAAILLGLGLQNRTIQDISEEIQLPVSQSLALFQKVIRKLKKSIKQITNKQQPQQAPTKKIVAVGNESQQLKRAGEIEKKKIFETSTKRENPSTYINYQLDDADLQNAQETNRGTITIARNIDKGRNADFKPKKKLKHR